MEVGKVRFTDGPTFALSK